jgi:hypothetical protein
VTSSEGGEDKWVALAEGACGLMLAAGGRAVAVASGGGAECG